MAEIDALLAQAVALNASDVHVMTGSPPRCRIHGMLEKMGDAEAVTDDLARRLFLEMLNDRQREQFEQRRDVILLMKSPTSGGFASIFSGRRAASARSCALSPATSRRLKRCIFPAPSPILRGSPEG